MSTGRRDWNASSARSRKCSASLPGRERGATGSIGADPVATTGAGGSGAAEPVGIIAEGGTLRLNRCIVDKNAKGGLLVNGAAFDIANSVFDGNGPGIGSFGSFGGVSLGISPGTAKFRNSTIVGNKQNGLVCERSTQMVQGLLIAGNVGGEVANCMVTGSKIGEDPKFDPARPYHLTASSPCRNAGELTDFPPDDLDGESRPQESRGDCGADEFTP